MGYMNMSRPLYPRPGDGGSRWNCRDRCDGHACESWRMPLFDHDCHHSMQNCDCGSQTVRLENPCCRGEYAEVTLSVDSCGNLVVGVHKDQWNCRKPKKRC